MNHVPLATLLARLGLNVRAAIERQTSQHGISYWQHTLLVEMTVQSGIHVRELARRAHLSRQAILTSAQILAQWGVIAIRTPAARPAAR